MKVGVQIGQQHTDVAELRRLWKAADDHLDSIWLWDHFFPLSGDPDGAHFECWTLLAAAAVETERVTLGPLVTAVGFRNPNLLADMARTVDHLSGGRLVLGLGAGWFERDYAEYGFDFGSATSRVEELAQLVDVIRSRLDRLTPPPLGPLPFLIGGGGERRLLPLAARAADIWNCIEDPESFGRKSRVLDEACRAIGRDPGEIERTVAVGVEDIDRWPEFEEQGATHLIVGLVPPYDLAPVLKMAEAARSSNR